MEIILRICRLATGAGLIVTLAVSTLPAFGQEDSELWLTVSRTFGYRAGDTIQGKFSLEVDGPAELVEVTFLIDGETMAQDRERPFQNSFHTSDYPVGTHRLMAIGRLAAGKELRTAERSFEFVTPDASFGAIGRIVIPLLLAVLGLTVVGVVAPALLIRKRGFRLGVYGSAGGAVCPRCQLPFARSFWTPNLFRGKVERCPHCGKWSVVARAPARSLKEAEVRFQAAGQPQVEAGPDRVKRLIDESRFES